MVRSPEKNIDEIVLSPHEGTATVILN